MAADDDRRPPRPADATDDAASAVRRVARRDVTTKSVRRCFGTTVRASPKASNQAAPVGLPLERRDGGAASNREARSGMEPSRLVPKPWTSRYVGCGIEKGGAADRHRGEQPGRCGGSCCWADRAGQRRTVKPAPALRFSPASRVGRYQRRIGDAQARTPSGDRCNMHRIDMAYAQQCLTAIVAFHA